MGKINTCFGPVASCRIIASVHNMYEEILVQEDFDLLMDAIGVANADKPALYLEYSTGKAEIEKAIKGLLD